MVIAGRIVLKNIKSGQGSELKSVASMGGHYGSLDGVSVFRLNQLSDIPAGVYRLGMEYAHQFNHLPSLGDLDDIPSVGHAITIAITDSSSGKYLSIPPRDSIRPVRAAELICGSLAPLGSAGCGHRLGESAKCSHD